MNYRDDTGPEHFPESWKPSNTWDLPDGAKASIWMTIYPSPRSMGMSDAYEVPDVWKENGKWFHDYKGGPAEIYADYVTHWRPSPQEEVGREG